MNNLIGILKESKETKTKATNELQQFIVGIKAHVSRMKNEVKNLKPSPTK